MGLPLLVLMHPRQENDEARQLKSSMRAARIGAELGADLVRVPYTGSSDSFKEVVSVCPVPLLATGGEKKVREKEVLEMVRAIMDAGAYGVSMGRNIFQYQKPGNMIKAIKQIVHKGSTVSSAIEALKEEPIESSIFSGTVIW